MKLYVGNLPWSIDDKGLQELFTSYGDIEEAVLIKDKFSGRSKGFGFVTFTDDGAAQKAIDEMNKKEVEGRPLTVSEAKPMVPRDNAPRYNDRENSEPSEAPMANPSEINGNVEDALDDEAAPEVVDDNSDAKEGEEKIETADEAVEDAEESKTE
jgi:RNA recognition motif-containing protein